MAKTATCALAAILLVGCDHGKELLTKGATAEAAGNLEEAAAQYRAACDEKSALCPIATRRIERLKLAEADRAFEAGEYRKAKSAIDLALASTDEGVKRAALAMSKRADLEKGLAWEEASAAAKPDDAFAAMEKLAREGFAVSPKAREWLAKNRLGILLDRTKAACAAKGTGSCTELGREIARLYPGSPESAEAKKLVDADYTRLFPLLQKAESLLGRRATIYVKDEKVRWCMWDKTNQAADENTFEGRNYTKPDESHRAECEGEVSPEPIPAVDEEWRKTLDAIGDLTFTKPLEERMKGAEEQGLYAPEAWPKPAKS